MKCGIVFLIWISSVLAYGQAATSNKDASGGHAGDEQTIRQKNEDVLKAYNLGDIGTLDKIEIVKSSGFPLLDAAAIKEMKQSRFEPAMDGAIPIRSRAQASVTYRLE